MKKALFSILFAALVSVSCTNGVREYKNPQSYADNVRDWYREIKVTYVEFTDTATLLTFSYKARVPNDYICLDSQTYLSDEKGRHYKVLFMAEHRLNEFFPAGPNGTTFNVGFEPMPVSTRIFDMIEGESPDMFKIIGIHDSGYVPSKPRFSRKQLREAEQLRRNIFKSGAVTLRGTIEDYDVNQGFRTYQMHFTDYPTGQTGTAAIEIDADGHFDYSFDVHNFFGAGIVDRNSEWHEFVAQAGDTLNMLFHKDGVVDCYLSDGRQYYLENYNRLHDVNVADYSRYAYADTIVLSERQEYALECRKLGLEYIDYIASKYNLTAFEYQYARIMLENETLEDYLSARMEMEAKAMSSAARGGIIEYSDYIRNMSVVDSVLLVPENLEYLSFFPANDTIMLIMPSQWVIFSYYASDPVFRKVELNMDSIAENLDDASIVFIGSIMEDSLYLENDKKLRGTDEPTLFGKICCMQGFENDLKNLLYYLEGQTEAYKDSVMTCYLARFQHLLNDANLASVAERIYVDFMRRQSPYWEIPECRGKDVLNNILANYPDKYVYIDFWSIGCGPCVAGIKNLYNSNRELMTAEHDKFAMIFITYDPEEAYEQFRKEWLEGAESYRLSQDDYNALAGLFNVSAIPHHEMITPDGRAITKVPEMWAVNPNDPENKNN